MNRTEFMDLLRYYFRRVSEAELAEILSDYEAHFEEGKKAGLSEEEICRELGSPKAVYEMYVHEGMIHEKDPCQCRGEALSAHAERLAGHAEKLAGQAGRAAAVTLDRAQRAWDETAPRLPRTLGTASDVLIRLLFWACYAAGFLVFVLTLFAVYLLSGVLFPGLSAVTLVFLTGTGVFAALALVFTGMELQKYYRSRKTTPPSSGTPERASAEAETADEEDGPQTYEAELVSEETAAPTAALVPAPAGRK